MTVVRSGDAKTGQKVALRWQSSVKEDDIKVYDYQIEEIGRLILVTKQVENWNATKVVGAKVPWGQEMTVYIGQHGVSLKFDSNDDRKFMLRWEEAVDMAEAILREHEAIQTEAKAREAAEVPRSDR